MTASAQMTMTTCVLISAVGTVQGATPPTTSSSPKHSASVERGSVLLRLDYNLTRHIPSQQWHWGSSPSTGCLQTVPRGSQRGSLDHGFCFPLLRTLQGSRGQDGRAELETGDG